MLTGSTASCGCGPSGLASTTFSADPKSDGGQSEFGPSKSPWAAEGVSDQKSLHQPPHNLVAAAKCVQGLEVERADIVSEAGDVLGAGPDRSLGGVAAQLKQVQGTNLHTRALADVFAPQR